MDIVRGTENGKPPWSPTVVNIMRQRKKKKSRAMLLLCIGAVVLCACACGGFAVTRPGTAAVAKSQPTLAVTPTRAPIAVQPVAGWTPVAGNPLIGYRVEPLAKP